MNKPPTPKKYTNTVDTIDPNFINEEKVTARPVAPNYQAKLDILREILEIERKRLQTAVRIEEERKIVFPETTIIIKDIERLLVAIENREIQQWNKANPKNQLEKTASDFGDLDF